MRRTGWTMDGCRWEVFALIAGILAMALGCTGTMPAGGLGDGRDDEVQATDTGAPPGPSSSPVTPTMDGPASGWSDAAAAPEQRMDGGESPTGPDDPASSDEGDAGASQSGGDDAPAGEPARAPSPYLIPVTLPDCDPDDPDTLFVRSASDLGRINDDRSIVCVEAGDYRSAGSIRLTRGGSEGSPRIIRYFSSNDPASAVHPVDMAEAERAILGGLELDGADHLVLSGLTVRGDGAFVRFPRGANSDHVVLDRVLVEGGGSGSGQLSIQGSNDHVTLQRSVLRRTEKRPDRDNHCIKVTGENIGTRVIANEIYDCAGDSIQIGTGGGVPRDRVEGAIIADNDMYLTNAMYSDCRGNLDPSGDCACAENAIDIKGTTDARDPVPESKWTLIVGNRMWGFREPDTGCGTSGGLTQSVVFHYGHTDNILFAGNVVMDVSGGVSNPDGEGSGSRGEHLSIVGNLFHNIHDPRESDEGYALNVVESYQGEYYFNTFVDVGVFLRARPTVSGLNDFRCNVIISGGRGSGQWANSETDHNAYYGTSDVPMSGPNDHVGGGSSDAMNDMYCVETKRLTDPTERCIANAITTAASPHAAMCDGIRVGSTRGIGIDDRIWGRDDIALP